MANEICFTVPGWLVILIATGCALTVQALVMTLLVHFSVIDCIMVTGKKPRGWVKTWHSHKARGGSE